jgi:hypothetical protein
MTRAFVAGNGFAMPCPAPAADPPGARRHSLGAILSVTTDVLLAPMGEVCELLSWMAGGPAFTHALPMLADRAKPVILRAHPALARVDASGVDMTNAMTWLSARVAEHGADLPIPRLPGVAP